MDFLRNNLLDNKPLLKELLKQSDLYNTINGGVSHTLIEYVNLDDKLIIKVSSPAVSGTAFKILVMDNQLTIFSVLVGFNMGLVPLDVYKVPIFRRTFEVPRNVDPHEIEAVLNGDELNVILPLKDNEEPKQRANFRK